MPPQNTSIEGNIRESRSIPFRYLFAAIAMLFLLVLAIITPDILPYFGPKFGISSPGTTPSPAPASAQSLPPNLFETYARLVTLFLALVSVLGVFFGYFVRKSIRETEEEVDKRFDRNMTLWEKERDGLLKKYNEDAERLKTSLGTVADLEKRLREALDESANAKLNYQRPVSPATKEVAQASAALDAQLESEKGGA